MAASQMFLIFVELMTNLPSIPATNIRRLLLFDFSFEFRARARARARLLKGSSTVCYWLPLFLRFDAIAAYKWVGFWLIVQWW